MRRPTTTLSAAAIGLALVLAGCAGDGSEKGTDGEAAASEEATPAGEVMPTVTAEFGTTPVIEFPGSGAPATLVQEIVVEGDGTEVGADDFVVANYVGVIWDGEQFDSSFDRGAPTMFSLNMVVPGWKEGLTGTRVGDRVLLSLPPEDGYGPDGNPGAGIEGTDTLVFVVDIVDTFAPDAQAQADATPITPDVDLPVTVEGELGAEATLAIVEGAQEPTEVETHVLAEGSGEPVSDVPGTSLLVQYAAVTWDGSTTESSWVTGALSQQRIGMGAVTDWLAGYPVGSRVVLLAPAGDAPGQPAAAFVFDIVGQAAAAPVTVPGESPSGESATD